MKQQQVKQAAPIPFLARYASKRTESQVIKGNYCTELSMWVINQDGEEISLIDIDCRLAELVTKTSSQEEADDQEDFSAMAELETKTANRSEHDNADLSVCLEMATKTDALMESDDTSSGANGMFL